MSISARKAKGTRIRDSRGDRVFTVVNYIILTLFGLAALYPLIYVLSASISEPLAVNSGRMKLWPVGFNIEGYKSILSNKWILTGYGNSLFYTVVGTFLNVLVTFMASYSLSRKDMYGHGLITFFMVFTMWFGGGLIPTFLVVKKLGLINTRMVLLLLGLVSVYNCIICRSFISSSIPYELQEAARIDGATNLQIFTEITLPLSKPMIVYTALTQFAWPWSDCLLPKLLLKNRDQWTVAVGLFSMPETHFSRFAAGSVFIAVPIVILYFCLVKHIVNGLTAGAVKG